MQMQRRDGGDWSIAMEAERRDGPDQAKRCETYQFFECLFMLIAQPIETFG